MGAAVAAGPGRAIVEPLDAGDGEAVLEMAERVTAAHGTPDLIVNAAARWALRGLHEALAQDLRGTGVRSSHVVFGEVSSGYFAHNPGAHDRLPGIARTVPVTTPERCAKVIMGAVRSPRAQVVYPFMMRLYYWSHLVAPWLVRWLLGRTGVRHA